MKSNQSPSRGHTGSSRVFATGCGLINPAMFPVRSLILLCALFVCIGLIGCGGGDDEALKQKEAEEKAAAAALEAAQANPVVVPLPWNYRPYQVKFWILPGEQPRLNRDLVQRMAKRVEQELELLEPAAWHVEADAVPLEWEPLLRNWEGELAELPDALYDGLEGLDKLVLVRLVDRGNGIAYQLNELDVNGWSLGPLYSGEVSELTALPGRLTDVTAEAFRPIVLISHTDGEIVTTRTRAYGLMYRAILQPKADNPEEMEEVLVPAKDSPCWIEEDEIFEPVVRQANRQRKFERSGIEALDFTLLVQQGKSEDQYVKAKVVSVSRSEVALGRKKGRNTEKIGIVVRTPPASTTIRLFTKRGTTVQNLQEFPLIGYQIYSRSIYGTEDSFEYLGKTNWNGEIEIEPGDERVRLLLVKNGERNLARLPVMPGYKPAMEKLLPDDEERILAEGVVSGLKSEALDLWARRAVLTERIKIALDKREFSMAERYYRLYQELIGVNQWNDMLANYERRLVSSERRQQEKITKMFAELKQFASKEFKLDDDAEIQRLMLDARKQQTTAQ